MVRSDFCLFTTIIALVFAVNAAASEVNVYSARKENLIKPLLDKFSLETGIQTNLITAKADKLLTRMISEGPNTPADVFLFEVYLVFKPGGIIIGAIPYQGKEWTSPASRQ